MMWSGPSTAIMGIRDSSTTGWQRAGRPASSCGFTLTVALICIRRSLRGFRFHPLGNAGDQVIVALEAFPDDNAFIGDFVLTNVFAVGAAAHFENHEDLTQLALNFHVAKPDDVVGEKRNGEFAEEKFGEGFLHFEGAQDGDADAGEGEDHAVERFPEVAAETGRQGHFKTGEGIDDEAGGAGCFDRVQYLLHGFVDGEIEGTNVDDLQVPVFDRGFQIEAKSGAAGGVFVGAFFQDGHNTRLSVTHAGGNELGGDDRFSGTRGACDQQTVALGDTAAEHFIQRGNADGEKLLCGDLSGARDQAERAGEGLQTVVGNAKSMHARDGGLAAKFHDVEFADHGVVLDNLVKPEEAVRDRKHGIIRLLGFGILADEKSGGLPTGQEQAKLLYEDLHLHLFALRVAHDGAKRVDDDNAGVDGFELFGDFPQDAVEAAVQ